MPAIQQLYDLQAVDTELGRHAQRLAEVGAKLGDRRTLDTVAAHLVRLSESVNAIAVRQRETDDAIASLTQRIGLAEARLYGGEVSNPRELEDLQADIAQLGRQRDDQEFVLLEVLEELDPVRAQRDEIDARLQVAETAWAADQSALVKEKADTEATVVTLTERREGLAAVVPASELGLYEQVRTRHPQGRGVAKVQNAMCESCRVALPMRQVQELRTATVPVRCPSCGLILLAE